MEEILRNILLGITLAAPVGPAGVAVIQAGLRFGFWRAFLTGLGITSADLTYMLVVYFGLSGFVNIPLVKILIWSMGALILAYLGLQSIREGGRKIDFEGPAAPSTRSPFLVGYLVNISNPIAVVFWLGIFGSLISASAGSHPGLVGLLKGSTILIGIMIWHTSMSVLTHWGKRFVNDKSARVISIAAGVVLLLFAVRFAISTIQTLLA